ncbi:lysozyme inhibitor LprI family protein [Cognatilysobacter terrigena]|uniref:lysozyme inhibitor LprI family protein n=1 Tax=Cognatilysobacter terrigena TaxID=2488749 RepID=UPI001061D730|nr:lysozyme inhibitor LprI family protein [Lysobacter terrigena]
MNRFALALCLTVGACSAPPSVQPATSVGAAAPNKPAASTSTPAVEAFTHGLRASYSACIDRAEAVIPATQACIEEEGAYQRDRLARALEAAKQKHADQAGAIQFQQTAWQADVDAKCKWDAGTEGQQQRIEANMCSLEAVAARADELNR